MSTVAAVAFWSLALLGTYSYFLYPLLLFLLPSRRQVTAGPVEHWPAITLVITAHNEAARIRAKLENVLALAPYPGDLQILVASDASTDGTDAIVAEYADRGVQLVRNSRREGKEAAQALAVKMARGDILVFSDVSTSMRGDVLQKIAAHFSDPSVGALSSTDRLVDRDGRPAGEGAYVRYEMRLRKEESRTASLVGLSGSFFAARADICRRGWQTDVPSDFLTAVNCVRQGYVAIAADDVLGYYPDLSDPEKEYRRKVRTVVRGMKGLARTKEVLSVRRYGIFAFQMWSHKVMRWAAPWLLLPLLPLNAVLAPTHLVYRATLTAQLAFYGLAILGMLSAKARRNLLVRIPHYFVVANAAVLHAGVDFLRGKSVVAWVPSER